MGDSREHDFRLLLRVLRERVVDATGLLEDGSAAGCPAARCRGACWTAPSSSRWPCQRTKRRPARRRAAPRRQAHRRAGTDPPPLADASAKITARAGSDRRGHPRGQPGAGLDVTGDRAREHAAAPRAAAWIEEARAQDGGGQGTGAAAHGRRDQAAAAAALPRPQDGAARGDRSRRRGPGAAEARQGRKEEVEAPGRRPPDADAVRARGRSRGGPHAAGRPPSAAGRRSRRRTAPWRSSTRSPSRATPCGPRFWPPRPGTRRRACPPASCSSSAGTRFEPKTEIIGPGYRAAYGLVAIVHHQIMERNEQGEPQLMDLRIRTHGTPGYRSVKRGESNGCHRLHNYVALRLSAFLVKHHEHVRDGLVPEDYVRQARLQGPGGRPREREQGLPLQADAARAGDRPRRRRQRRRQGRQAHGAAGRGAVAAAPRTLRFVHETQLPSSGYRARW